MARSQGSARDRVLAGVSVIVYAFLYVPILVLIALSFNATGRPSRWGGFSTQWYSELLRSPELIASFKNTLVVALAVTAISTVLGTLLAIGLERTVKSSALDSALFLPAVVPDIVLAIGLLSFFTFAKVSLGLHTIVAAHVVFAMIFVAAIVRTRLGYFDRSIEEAAQDLGAGRAATFFRVTLPLILPGIVAGALVAFTLSFDEFIIAFFTTGPTTATFPIEVYSRIRFGLTPVINAVATILLLVSFSLILIAVALNGRAAKRALEHGTSR
jgi:spermidine/putrescine transport system permease protein